MYEKGESFFRVVFFPPVLLLKESKRKEFIYGALQSVKPVGPCIESINSNHNNSVKKLAGLVQ